MASTTGQGAGGRGCGVTPWDHDVAMSADFDRAARERLATLRAAARQRAAHLGETFDGIVAAASDVATDDEHDPEGHTIAWERQQVAGLLDGTQSTLAAIVAAERRLDEGRYGMCTECAEAIAPERLAALPATPTCVRCAARTGI